MTSNYNVLWLPIEDDGKWKLGDTFTFSDRAKSMITDLRLLKFDGLEIKNIDYNFGVRLHFDWNEWDKAKIVLPKRNLVKNKIKFF